MSDPSSGSSFEKAPNCCQGLSNVESIVKSVQGPHPQIHKESKATKMYLSSPCITLNYTKSPKPVTTLVTPLALPKA